MGQSYSEPTLKVKLKMGVQRCNMVVNKKNNAIKVSRKELATLLSKGKSESARIKVEGVIGEMNMVRVLEILALMLELLLQRITLISGSREPPDDLIESMATIIYCAKRVDIPELAEVATQLQLKFGPVMGPEWAKQHLANAHKKVSPKVIERLAVTPPSFDTVIAFLKEVAEQYELEWEPNFEKPSDDDNPDKIGAIAPIHAEGEDTGEDEAKLGASYYEAKGSEYPGTINIIVHQCKELTSDKPSDKLDVYVQLSIDGLTPILKTSVDFNGDKAPKWEEEHFPFSIKGLGYQLKIEVFASRSPKDKLIGSTLLSCDSLISAQKRNWYPLTREKGAKAGQIEISTQYLPLRVAPHPSYVRGEFALPPVPTTDPRFSPSGGGSGGTLVTGPPMTAAAGPTVMMGGPPMMPGGQMVMGPSGPMMIQASGPPMMMTSAGPMMMGSGPMMMGPPMMMVPGGTHPMMMGPAPGTQGTFVQQTTVVPMSGTAGGVAVVPDPSASVSSMSSSSSSSSSATSFSSSSLSSMSSASIAPALSSTPVFYSSTSDPDPSASEKKTKVVAPEPAEAEDEGAGGEDDGDAVPGFDELERRFKALKGIS